MKVLKYQLCTKVDYGTPEAPDIRESFSPVRMEWNEANEEIAKAEAYNGEYTIEDDGQEKPKQPTDAERIAALEAQLAAYEAAYTEGVNEA